MTEESRDCQGLLACKVGWGHRGRGGYQAQRDSLARKDPLVLLDLVADKALMGQQESEDCKVPPECRAQEDARESRETLN